jgi:hypothetical protein
MRKHDYATPKWYFGYRSPVIGQRCTIPRPWLSWSDRPFSPATFGLLAQMSVGVPQTISEMTLNLRYIDLDRVRELDTGPLRIGHVPPMRFPVEDRIRLHSVKGGSRWF